MKSYNSNGLWLREPEALAAEAIELRDEGARDDLAAIMAAWDAAGVPLCVLLGVGSWGDYGARPRMIEATLSTIVDAQAHRYQEMQRTRRAFGIELTQPVGGYRPRFAPSPIQYHVP